MCVCVCGRVCVCVCVWWLSPGSMAELIDYQLLQLSEGELALMPSCLSDGADPSKVRSVIAHEEMAILVGEDGVGPTA